MNPMGIDISLVSSPAPAKWRCDWACDKCGTFGNIVVEVTGGPRDALTGKLQPKTDDETYRKLLWQAHREASGGVCVQKVKRLLLGRLWRWQRKGETRGMVILTSPGENLTEYAWPPRRPPWVAK